MLIWQIQDFHIAISKMLTFQVKIKGNKVNISPCWAKTEKVVSAALRTENFRAAGHYFFAAARNKGISEDL